MASQLFTDTRIMSKVKKTKDNPYGLSAKEKMMADDIVETVKSGKPMKAVQSTKKFYNTSTDNSARVITSQKFAKTNFREHILAGLHKKDIIGADSRVENRLDEGLDATTEDGKVDYANRLNYIKEINKIAGVYAAQQVEKKTLNLTLDLSEEELDAKIAQLNEELG